MANRTLRRARNGVAGNEPAIGSTVVAVPDGTGSDASAEPVIGGNVDDSANNAGADGGEPSQRVGVVELDPEQLSEFIAGNDTGSGTSDGEGDGTRRTRKPRADAGAKRGSRKAIPQNIEAIATMVHTWAAVFLKCPELTIDKAEAKQLSDAYEEFSKHHEVPLLTAKRMSEINLIATLCIVEGTRVVAIVNRKKEERRAADAKRAPFTVINNNRNNG